MKKFVQPVFILALFALGAYGTAESQQGAEIEWMQSGDQFYKVQRTPGSTLLLTPNESFFPKLGLRAGGEETVTGGDSELNQGVSFKTIEKWSSGDQAEWGLWLEKTGQIKVRVWMANATEKGEYSLSFGKQKKTFSPGKAGDAPSEVANVLFKVKEPGRHSLLLTCEDESKGASTQLHTIEITGPAVVNAGVIRKRWRPSAAHTSFSNSADPAGVRLVIMEMDGKPGMLDFYSPITTPFGYYGSSWKTNGLVGTGFNFSLWSFGSGKEEPPIDQLSHLIAVGDPGAKFGGFSHEGTGVKIREWKPLEGRQGQRQAFAIRMEPGEKYTTYFTYFFATDEQRWRLFGVGKTYNKRKPRTTLGIGSFVEVPGRSRVERTGVYERRMRYRGWVVDGSGQLHPYDQMAMRDVDKAGMTETDRGVTDDGWFYLQTGGWSFRKAEKKKPITLPIQVSHRVDYLGSDDLAFLQTVPCEIVGTGIKQTASGAKVSFNIRNLGKNPEVTIYWGAEEGLTFSNRWKNCLDVKNSREGANSVVIDAPAGKPLFVRLFLKNDEGQFWSMDTLEGAAAK